MTKKLLIFLLLPFLGACAGSDDKKKVDELKNYQSGNCGIEVVSDYNSVVYACDYIRTTADAISCRSKAQSFIDKYPGINCQAEKQSSYSVDNEQFTITTAPFEEIVEKLKDY